MAKYNLWEYENLGVITHGTQIAQSDSLEEINAKRTEYEHMAQLDVDDGIYAKGRFTYAINPKGVMKIC